MKLSVCPGKDNDSCGIWYPTNDQYKERNMTKPIIKTAAAVSSWKTIDSILKFIYNIQEEEEEKESSSND